MLMQAELRSCVADHDDSRSHHSLGYS